VEASQPRLIRYVVANIGKAKDADFALTVPGVELETVGPDIDSYRVLEAEIERSDRNGPIVLVSPIKGWGGPAAEADWSRPGCPNFPPLR
jgi:hypothetical protein